MLGELNGYAEAGDDTFALKFRAHSVDSMTLALGLKGEFPIQWRGGELTPALRLEFRQALRSSGSPLVTYADWDESPIYRVNLSPYETQSLWLGSGLTWAGPNWTFSFDADASVFDQHGEGLRLRAGATGKF